jgi:hypothetical protein
MEPNLCLVEPNLCLVEPNLCLVESNLCLVESNLCLVEPNLCLVEPNLCLVGTNLCLVESNLLESNHGLVESAHLHFWPSKIISSLACDSRSLLVREVRVGLTGLELGIDVVYKGLRYLSKGTSASPTGDSPMRDLFQNGFSSDSDCGVNSFAPSGVMCMSSSSRTPNSPRM